MAAFKRNSPGCCACSDTPDPCAGKSICVTVIDQGTGEGKSGVSVSIVWRVPAVPPATEPTVSTSTGTTDDDGRFCADPPDGGHFVDSTVNVADDCIAHNSAFDGTTDPEAPSCDLLPFLYCEVINADYYYDGTAGEDPGPDGAIAGTGTSVVTVTSPGGGSCSHTRPVGPGGTLDPSTYWTSGCPGTAGTCAIKGGTAIAVYPKADYVANHCAHGCGCEDHTGYIPKILTMTAVGPEEVVPGGTQEFTLRWDPDSWDGDPGADFDVQLRGIRWISDCVSPGAKGACVHDDRCNCFTWDGHQGARDFHIDSSPRYGSCVATFGCTYNAGDLLASIYNFWQGGCPDVADDPPECPDATYLECFPVGPPGTITRNIIATNAPFCGWDEDLDDDLDCGPDADGVPFGPPTGYDQPGRYPRGLDVVMSAPCGPVYTATGGATLYGRVPEPGPYPLGRCRRDITFTVTE